MRTNRRSVLVGAASLVSIAGCAASNRSDAGTSTEDPGTDDDPTGRPDIDSSPTASTFEMPAGQAVRVLTEEGDYGGVTVESSCLDEPKIIEPGRTAVVSRDTAGERCSVRVLIGDEEKWRGVARGSEQFDLHVTEDGEVKEGDRIVA